MTPEEFRQSYTEAQVLFRSRAYESALERLDALLAHTPRHRGVRFSRALCLERLGRKGEALAVAAQLLREQDDPRVRALHERLATSGDVPEAAPQPRRYVPSDEEARLLAEQIAAEADAKDPPFQLKLTDKRMLVLLVLIMLLLAVMGPVLWWRFIGLSPG